MSLNIGILSADRENNELYTPYYAVDPILKYIPKDWKVWCPCDEKWSAFYNKCLWGGIASLELL